MLCIYIKMIFMWANSVHSHITIFQQTFEWRFFKIKTREQSEGWKPFERLKNKTQCAFLRNLEKNLNYISMKAKELLVYLFPWIKVNWLALKTSVSKHFIAVWFCGQWISNLNIIYDFLLIYKLRFYSPWLDRM